MEGASNLKGPIKEERETPLRAAREACREFGEAQEKKKKSTGVLRYSCTPGSAGSKKTKNKKAAQGEAGNPESFESQKVQEA